MPNIGSGFDDTARLSDFFLGNDLGKQEKKKR